MAEWPHVDGAREVSERFNDDNVSCGLRSHRTLTKLNNNVTVQDAHKKARGGSVGGAFLQCWAALARVMF